MTQNMIIAPLNSHIVIGRVELAMDRLVMNQWNGGAPANVMLTGSQGTRLDR